MDLVRFALAGAPGTPYHDHLFLFDAAFPADYPASPPRLAYHAHGVRVNPNLYACGKVCLSLLGTWAGTRPGEAWDPAASTLLQVIVSLQGLVLTAEPYYQEAGYEAQRADGGAGGAGAGGGGPASQEAAKNARLYSESAFLAPPRPGLGRVRRPPPPFGPLIRAHYKARAGPYLAACGAYVRGEAGIGAWEEEEEKKEEGEGRDAQAPPAASALASAPPPPPPPPPPPTEGFRLMLKGLVPTLEEAFGKL
jgi:ubiquitin-conjugating enzyme E2 O